LSFEQENSSQSLPSIVIGKRLNHISGCVDKTIEVVSPDRNEIDGSDNSNDE
jgi:hypothetical protein